MSNVKICDRRRMSGNWGNVNPRHRSLSSSVEQLNPITSPLHSHSHLHLRFLGLDSSLLASLHTFRPIRVFRYVESHCLIVTCPGAQLTLTLECRHTVISDNPAAANNKTSEKRTWLRSSPQCRSPLPLPLFTCLLPPRLRLIPRRNPLKPLPSVRARRASTRPLVLPMPLSLNLHPTSPRLCARSSKVSLD